MKVEFFRHQLGEKNLHRFARVMESIFLTTGKEVALFEEKFADYLGQKFALGLMSGTAGLHIALLALGIGPGDEVITTPMTFVATALAIMHAGARPVFVDVEPETGNLDADLVAAAINAKTKAIMPVHLYGQMVDMRRLKELSQAHNLLIIEDAAHCLEGERDGITGGRIRGCRLFQLLSHQKHYLWRRRGGKQQSRLFAGTLEEAAPAWYVHPCRRSLHRKLSAL